MTTNKRRQVNWIVVVIVVSGLVVGGTMFWLVYASNIGDPDPFAESRGQTIQPATVTLEDEAMQPTLLKGTRVTFGPQPTYNADQIVWLNDPTKGPSVRYVRRIVGVAGDTIRLSEGRVYRNDQLLTESYVSQPDTTTINSITLQAGQVYVLCDNRAVGPDSRQWGAIPTSLIRGASVK